MLLLVLLLAAQDPLDPRDRGVTREIPRDEVPGLWYGTPGVAPGKDLIGPVLELLREPGKLLELTPRKLPGYWDQELDRFERILERGLDLPRIEVPPER